MVGDPQRPQAGEALPDVGRAKRFACVPDTGTPAELWTLSSSDAAIAKRLVAFGEKGVGGFSRWGEDADGVFLLRRIPSKTVDVLAKGEKLEGMIAIQKLRDLAKALAQCERSAIFPGPLRPSEIALGSAGRTDAFVLAEGWVRALLGDHPKGERTSAPGARWTPPEQAGGAPWDNAANRYVLGLIAYRLIAGAHPFSGIGLRDAMGAQASAPPPFDEAIARTLKPGVQSLILAMIDPSPAARPSSAHEIVERCEALIHDDYAVLRPPRGGSARGDTIPDPPRALQNETREAPRDAAAELRAHLASPSVAAGRPARAASPTATPLAAPPAASAPRWKRLALAITPIAIGVVIAGVGLASAQSTTAPPPIETKKVTTTQAPLAKTTAEACGACHARQVAEWQRSVMAHAVKSPLFGALESVVEEQVGRDDRCPNGAGVLRRAGGDVCRDEKSGLALTGTGGEHWCVNCHSAGDNLKSTVPSWGASFESAGVNALGTTRKPLRDVLTPAAMEGISCAVCHQTIGPVHAGATGIGYEGNPTWTSPVTGAVFRMRPEDGTGKIGISNSGYKLDPSFFLKSQIGGGGSGDPIVHGRTPADTRRYLQSSDFCGACHDVRLFGTDTLGVRDRGEHFKRLRNAYSEWRTWAEAERAAGRAPASCQDCHMSLYPGVCVADSPSTKRDVDRTGCPQGFHFEARAPGEKAKGTVASSSGDVKSIASHYFTSVDLPLATDFPKRWATDETLDASGQPLGLEARRAQLLRRTFRFTLGAGTRVGSRLEVPLEITNIGAGHRVPAGFSQEREIWVELTVKDARGNVVYEVGKIASDDSDLQDKAFIRITTRDDVRDFKGKPQGVFGADVIDGPDLPRWSPNPIFGGTSFRGRGLINMQNGFLRCVKCIGRIDAQGQCQPVGGQGRTRADRFDDGIYDIDTGECRSNLVGQNALFETYFPVGALDAERGIAKAPDAIIDTRSAPPGTTLKYTYELEVPGRQGPFTVSARLRFRPFPPFLLRAFADYEARKAAQGLRPSGAQVTPVMFEKNHPIDIGEVSGSIP